MSDASDFWWGAPNADFVHVGLLAYQIAHEFHLAKPDPLDKGAVVLIVSPPVHPDAASYIAGIVASALGRTVWSVTPVRRPNRFMIEAKKD
jgi:hypothetical protein